MTVLGLPPVEEPADPSASADGPSVYRLVAAQLDALIPLLGLQAARSLVARSYELVCREALAFEPGHRPLRPSRVNADGTPFQLSLALGASGARLQFLSDTGAAGQSNARRLASDRARIWELAQLFGAQQALSSIESLVEQLAPSTDHALLTDHAGPTWIGAGFSPRHPPSFKVYINAKWGEQTTRWARLHAFARRFGLSDDWRALREMLDGDLEPLGVALVVSARAPVTGRIYLSGYGKPFAYLEALGRAFGGSAFEEQLRRYGRTVLRDDYRYPTRSVVCSLGIGERRTTDFKVELCGHCAFDSDVQALARCAEWLRNAAVDAAVYEQVVALLSSGAPSSSVATLHAYVGLGSGQGTPESTFYFNPAPGLG
jgi:hypothetical protein